MITSNLNDMMKKSFLPFEGISSFDDIKSMPKIDLHRHLTGSIRISTLVEVAKRNNISLPFDHERNYDYEEIKKRIIAERPVKNLSSFIRTRWGGYFNKIPKSPSIFTRLTFEAIEDAYLDNIKYLELRVSPYWIFNEDKYTFLDFLNSLKEGILQAKTNYPTIITRIILSIPRHVIIRHFSISQKEVYYKTIIENCSSFQGEYIVGFDLAGEEMGYPPRSFSDFFPKVKSMGYKITIHAGETGNSKNISEAIDVLQADRVGHGIMAQNDKQLINYLRASKIPLEICPTSNFITGVVSSLSEHPIKKLQDAGVATTVNTDDPVVFDTTLSEEYFKIWQRLQFSINDIKKTVKTAAISSFLPENEKAKLIKMIDHFFNVL